MKKILFILFLLILLLALAEQLASRPAAIILRLSKYDFSAVNEAHYRIRLFGFIPVGEAVLKREKSEDYYGQPVLHLSASAYSAKMILWIFSGSAQIDSYIDKLTLNPALFMQKIS